MGIRDADMHVWAIIPPSWLAAWVASQLFHEEGRFLMFFGVRGWIKSFTAPAPILENMRYPAIRRLFRRLHEDRHTDAAAGAVEDGVAAERVLPLDGAVVDRQAVFAGAVSRR